LPERKANSLGSKSSDKDDMSPPGQEKLLLTQESGRKLAQALDIPELEVELERAIWQVEAAIRKQSEDAKKPASSSEPKRSKAEEK
jgi:hypothetical protein